MALGERGGCCVSAAGVSWAWAGGSVAQQRGPPLTWGWGGGSWVPPGGRWGGVGWGGVRWVSVPGRVGGQGRMMGRLCAFM